MANNTKPVGGGGTDVTCVPEYIKDNNITPQCAIVVTDGHLYGGWGAWTCPVLWVILDNAGAVPTHGIALHVNSRDL
jgi:predicted metal-dependent peptidase